MVEHERKWYFGGYLGAMGLPPRTEEDWFLERYSPQEPIELVVDFTDAREWYTISPGAWDVLAAQEITTGPLPECLSLITVGNERWVEKKDENWHPDEAEDGLQQES